MKLNLEQEKGTTGLIEFKDKLFDIVKKELHYKG